MQVAPQSALAHASAGTSANLRQRPALDDEVRAVSDVWVTNERSAEHDPSSGH